MPTSSSTATCPGLFGYRLIHPIALTTYHKNKMEFNSYCRPLSPTPHLIATLTTLWYLLKARNDQASIDKSRLLLLHKWHYRLMAYIQRPTLQQLVQVSQSTFRTWTPRPITFRTWTPRPITNCSINPQLQHWRSVAIES
jgi:hypothetical protein